MNLHTKFHTPRHNQQTARPQDYVYRNYVSCKSQEETRQINIDYYQRQPWLKDNNQSGHYCNEKCPLFLLDFNQIYILKTELSNPLPPPQVQNFIRFRP